MKRFINLYHIIYNMELIKNIKIEEEIWWELNKLKVEWKLRTLSDVITRLVKNRR